jgi:excisionase family DNA binding protein
MTDEQPERWLTVRDVAEELQIHEESVRRWVRADQLPAVSLGSRRGGYRIRRSDLDRFLGERFGTLGKAPAAAA